jgi:hypothetical protein
VQAFFDRDPLTRFEGYIGDWTLISPLKFYFPRVVPYAGHELNMAACSNVGWRAAAVIANPHVPASGPQLAESAVGVVFRLNSKYQTFGLWKTGQN